MSRFQFFIKKKKKEKKNIYLFYIENSHWENEIFDEIEYGYTKVIKKNDLPINIRNKNVFITLSSKNLKKYDPPFDDKSLNTTPSWRANIKIFSSNAACSYQGEIPGGFINKNLSLVSCSPFIQTNNASIQNYFYLVNLMQNPATHQFDVEILNTSKQVLNTIKCHTNKVNLCDLSFLDCLNDKMFIFRSSKYGGIPLYFSKNLDNTQMSLEHTHPPTEYLFSGDRLSFQKKKKSYWFV